MLPPVVFTSPAMPESRLVLPAPLAPMTPTISPGLQSRLTPRTAGTGP